MVKDFHLFLVDDECTSQYEKWSWNQILAQQRNTTSNQ